MARVLIIYNPSAARTSLRALAAMEAVFVGEGWACDTAATTGHGDAFGLAQQAAASGADVVAVYGGDGTMIQAVAGMLGCGVLLGLLPGGTGNLLAGNLGIPRDPVRAARTIVAAHTRSIDLGRMSSDGAVKYFAVACGAGFDAELMAGTTGTAKSRWGMTAYVAKAVVLLRQPQVSQYRIRVDGERMDVAAATVMVANCGQIIPPYLRLKDDIAPDDGQLDVVALKADGWIEGLSLLGRLVTGRTNGGDRIRYARGREIAVDSDRPRPTQLDGEAVGSTPFTADVLSRAVEVIVPGNGKA